MVLKVHNLSLPLMYTPQGPVLSIEDKSLETIGWIVNLALDGDISQFTDSLARGDDIYLQEPLYAVRPTLYNDLEEANVRWHELTGEELGEDVYVLGTTFTHQVILPRQTLLSIIQSLFTLRAELPEPPPAPWLFRRSPYDLGPGEGEKKFVCGLEERAARFKKLLEQEERAEMTGIRRLMQEFSAAGLFSEAYFKEKQMWLEMWSCPTLLAYHRAALTFLNHFRSQKQQIMPSVTPGAPPVAILQASICVGKREACLRGALERKRDLLSKPLARSHKGELIELEQRAQAFGRILETPQSDKRAFDVAREALVRDLEAVGLFSEAYVEEKEHCLRMLQYPRLETYHKAALDFLNHFRSPPLFGTNWSQKGGESEVVPKGTSGMPLLSLSISIDKLEFPYVAAYSSLQ